MKTLILNSDSKAATSRHVSMQILVLVCTWAVTIVKSLLSPQNCPDLPFEPLGLGWKFCDFSGNDPTEETTKSQSFERVHTNLIGYAGGLLVMGSGIRIGYAARLVGMEMNGVRVRAGMGKGNSDLTSEPHETQLGIKQKMSAFSAKKRTLFLEKGNLAKFHKRRSFDGARIWRGAALVSGEGPILALKNFSRTK